MPILIQIFLILLIQFFSFFIFQISIHLNYENLCVFIHFNYYMNVIIYFKEQNIFLEISLILNYIYTKTHEFYLIII